MTPPTVAVATALAAIGLEHGERVRFRRSDRSRWELGQVACVEHDGSLRVTDRDGAARTFPMAQVQVQARRKGQWEALADRSSRAVQMRLEFPAPSRRRRS